MKVLHIIPSLTTGGAQKLLGDLLPIINSCPDIEIELVVFNLSESNIEKKLIESGIAVKSLGLTSRSPLAIFKLRKYFRQSDIVHLHLFPVHYYAYIANIGIKKPLIFTEHSTGNKRRNHKFLRPIEKIIYGNLDRIICISEATKKALANWLHQNESDFRFKVINNGIDIEKYRNASILSTKSLFGREGKAILMISRFTESKDHASVVKALTHIPDTDIFIVFAGEGPTMENIKELANELNVIDRIVFLGNRNDIPELIKASALGVQSSLWEGFGLTAVEMMAGGLPVLASDVEGLRDIVNGAGIVFERSNEILLSEKIKYVMNNKTVYENMINAGEKRCSKFNITFTASEYIDLYQSIFGKLGSVR